MKVYKQKYMCIYVYCWLVGWLIDWWSHSDWLVGWLIGFTDIHLWNTLRGLQKPVLLLGF